MVRYVLTRGASMLPVLVLLSVGTFLLLRLAPGDPVRVMLGQDADAATVERIRGELGLDRPLPVQYVIWAPRVLQGALGRSTRTTQPVGEAIAARLPVTIELSILGLALSLLVGIPAGVLSATRAGSLADRVVSVVAVGGIAI